MKTELTIFPGPIAARRSNSVDLVIKIDSTKDMPMWYEAEVRLPPALSLSQAQLQNSGRFRLGIVEPRGYLQKEIKVHASHNTAPQLYKCDVAIFAYDQNANLKDRTDTHVQLRCENR
ncbi:MAG: hypothetical protein PHQ80_02325 [Candidatus ainarchaeum sp.]|nr:hypothetical protein [Candidatus ainarchaeum sp.]